MTLVLLLAGALAQQAAGAEAPPPPAAAHLDFEYFKARIRADPAQEAGRPRPLRDLSRRQRQQRLPARPAVAGCDGLDGGAVAEELRGACAVRRAGRAAAQPAPEPSARSGRWRRSVPRRGQALVIAARSGMADARRVGAGPAGRARPQVGQPGRPHHSDQRRGRQRPPDRSGHEQGGRRDQGHRDPHGVTSAPDGSRIYISNESMHTLDVVDGKSSRSPSGFPLSGRPNNVAITKDGRKVYVGIAQAPGALDVIDTVTLENVKTVPVKGAIHNVYVTPDSKLRRRRLDPEEHHQHRRHRDRQDGAHASR